MTTRPSTAQSRTKARLVTLCKLVFVAAFLYFLAQKGFISVSATKAAFGHVSNMSIALGLYVINLFVGVYRWKILLDAQAIRLSYKRVLQLSMVGNFFNIALPGAVSGDFVKAFYIGREVEGQRGRAFGSILFDRVVGVSALVLVSAGALLIGFDQFWGTSLLRAVQVFISTAAICVIVFYSYLFLVREDFDPVLNLLKWLQIRVAKAATFVRLYESMKHYHNHRGAVLKALAVSVCIHMMVAYSCYNFLVALDVEHIQWLALCLVVPLGLLVTAVPVAPAGVGTGHAAFLYFFKLIGTDRGADVFSLVALVSILTGAAGGIVYLRFRAREPQPVLETT